MSENVLICGTNWLGDSVMSMPAVHAFKKESRDCRITLLVKSKLVPLWSMFGGIDDVIELQGGSAATFAAAGTVRGRHFDKAYVLPNSFRSALIPFIAGIPVRVGAAGHMRSWMLTEVSPGRETPGKEHQLWEYFRILKLGEDRNTPGIPPLLVPAAETAKARERLVAGKTWIGMLPGAARGSSKRWPASCFVEVGKAMAKSGYGIVIMGSAHEAALCAGVAGGIEGNVVNLAGQTSLTGLAAFLGSCRVVVTNDSGGMHLAAAVGTPLVAIFGITDPSKTGPLGKTAKLILAEGVSRSRDIDRSSEIAESSLRSIKPEQVCEAVKGLLGV
jgi:heptosyltransferase-2